MKIFFFALFPSKNSGAAAPVAPVLTRALDKGNTKTSYASTLYLFPNECLMFTSQPFQYPLDPADFIVRY